MVPVTEEVEPETEEVEPEEGESEPETEEGESEPETEEVEDDGIDQLKAEIAKLRKLVKTKKSKKSEQSLEDGSISMGDKYVATVLNGKVEIKQIGWVGPSELVVHKDDFANFLEVLQSL